MYIFQLKLKYLRTLVASFERSLEAAISQFQTHSFCGLPFAYIQWPLITQESYELVTCLYGLACPGPGWSYWRRRKKFESKLYYKGIRYFCLKILCIIFREGGREGERRERTINVWQQHRLAATCTSFRQEWALSLIHIWRCRRGM